MAKNGSKKKTEKPILLGALKRAIPVCKDEDGIALVRFSISENGNLLLSSGSHENGSTSEEIPEALVVKPGGPGLLVGDFGIVNLSSDPLDFQIDAAWLLRSLKTEKRDPTIIFAGRHKPVEFSWGPEYRFLIAPVVADEDLRAYVEATRK
jgi:hypothetical protein